MVGINLKKLVLRTEQSLIQDVINATGADVSIETADGERFFGDGAEGEQRHGIEIDGQVVGWVIGNQGSETLANLISRLAHREFEKRQLAHELLGKYKEISFIVVNTMYR